jgi:hypothetical protein
MDIKPLKRYDAGTEYDTGPDVCPYSIMVESPGGGYINEDELRERLNKMLAEACDPGEKDALNSVLKLIDTPNW